jgi:hypothetical protein
VTLLSGTLADLDLASIAAVTSLGRAQLRLDLYEAGGRLIGSIVLKAGRVVSAIAGAKRGRDALHVIMTAASDTRFRLTHEPLDFMTSGALVMVDELQDLRRRQSSMTRPASLADGTGSRYPALEPTPTASASARVAMMQGRLAEFDMLSLLQTIGVGRQLVDIEVRDPAGSPVGNVTVKSGKVVSASAGDSVGIRALSQLVKAPASYGFAAFRVTANIDDISALASVSEICFRFATAPAVVANRPVMKGSLSEFDLPTLIQTVGVSRQHSALEIHDELTIVGAVYLKSGIVLSVTAGELTGIPALHYLLTSHSNDSFRVLRMHDDVSAREPLGSIGRVLLELSTSELSAPPSGPSSTTGQADAAPDLWREPAASPEPPVAAPVYDGRIGSPIASEPVLIEGNLSDFDLRTLLESLATTRQHTRLQILDRQSGPIGDVTFKAGWLLSGQAGALRGRDALALLLSASRQLRFRVQIVSHGVGSQTPIGSIPELLAGFESAPVQRPLSATRLLRWIIPLSFFLGGSIVFFMVRGSHVPAPHQRDAAAVETRVEPPAAPVAPPPRAALAPAALPGPAETAAPSVPIETATPPVPAETAAPPVPIETATPPVAVPETPPPAPPASPVPPAPADDLAVAPDEIVVQPPAPPVKQGSRTAVRKAQAALKRLGFDPGPIDNVYGRSTRAAIMQLQRSQGLPVTGALDHATWAAMVSSLAP